MWLGRLHARKMISLGSWPLPQATIQNLSTYGQSLLLNIPFLDMFLILRDGRVATSIHYKETNSHSYLNFKSSHPFKCKVHRGDRTQIGWPFQGTPTRRSTQEKWLASCATLQTAPGHSIEDVRVAVLKSGLARKDLRKREEMRQFLISKHSLLTG